MVDVSNNRKVANILLHEALVHNEVRSLRYGRGANPVSLVLPMLAVAGTATVSIVACQHLFHFDKIKKVMANFLISIHQYRNELVIAFFQNWIRINIHASELKLHWIDQLTQRAQQILAEVTALAFKQCQCGA